MATQLRDATDDFIDQWRARRPDLDTAPMAVIGRLHRLAAILDTGVRPVFAEHGLSADDFDVLATLRRWGRPMTPSELARSVLVASGTVTKRLDRLERRGLLLRSPSPHDGRGRLVELTPDGLSLADMLAERHWANEDRLLAPLDGTERTQLAGLLRKLLVAHE
ncbi:MAG TPA: MarR family transcriptional regulator [Marmoricola sp.]|nr:MarR family transcriptional regulator [Marmoricola sp.]